MGKNGKRIAVMDNSQQFNPDPMAPYFPVDQETSTEPWIHDEHKLGRRKVAMSDLVATQERYNADKVAGVRANRKPGLPLVVLTDNGLLIHDGHHRLIADKQDGKKYVYVDAYEGRTR